MADVASPDVIKELTSESLFLHTKWNVFESLFGGGKSDVEVLNRRTGFIFWVFQDSLIDEVIMRIARLLDNPTFGKGPKLRHNITLDLAVQSLPLHVNDNTRGAFTSRIENLRSKCDAIISHRNRRIGHVDHDAALKRDPLPPIKWHDIRNAVAETQQLLSEISMALDGTEIKLLDRADEDHQVAILRRILTLGNEAIDVERKAKSEKWKKIMGVDDFEAPDDPLNDDPGI